jgi:hypothetical protein
MLPILKRWNATMVSNILGDDDDVCADEEMKPRKKRGKERMMFFLFL